VRQQSGIQEEVARARVARGGESAGEERDHRRAKEYWGTRGHSFRMKPRAPTAARAR
jgi:hypothetical protein